MRSADWQCEEEAAAWLPPSDFLHFLCHVLAVGRPPEVELRACWPFDVHSSAAWAGMTAELGVACCALKEGSSLRGCTPADGRGWPGGQPRKTVEIRGPGNMQMTCRVGAARSGRRAAEWIEVHPGGEVCGSPSGELAYWCMVQGLVAGPSSEETLGLLRGTFWEHQDCPSPGLPARRREHPVAEGVAEPRDRSQLPEWCCNFQVLLLLLWVT
ncbi:hypothetical protein NDU88_004452 [Pleurodeles waltl]|uniref:Uncharacterized protein n=1 Tax=Pleurodeles waltl TaxID=8319 RepID=A0AAV7LUN4_PLEWA|nr:hypothetical protein NDU88_004452 [Pleurodeles waltl]